MAFEKITFVNSGFLSVLNSSGVSELVESEAKAMAERAGDGFESKVVKGRARRPVGIVYADTYEAKEDEAENKSLTRAVM